MKPSISRPVGFCIVIISELNFVRDLALATEVEFARILLEYTTQPLLVKFRFAVSINPVELFKNGSREVLSVTVMEKLSMRVRDTPYVEIPLIVKYVTTASWIERKKRKALKSL